MLFETNKDLQSQTSNIIKGLQVIKDKLEPPYKKKALELKANIKEDVENIENQLPNPTTSASIKNVDFEIWEALAYDIALEDTDDYTIADGYGISYDQLQELRRNKFFAKMIKSKQEEVKSLGTEAAFTVKFRMITNRAAQEYMRRLSDPKTSNKDFLAFFKLATELGKLMPKEEDEAQPQQVFGATVTFNIQGVPGLDHLTKSNETLDAEYAEIVTETNELEVL